MYVSREVIAREVEGSHVDAGGEGGGDAAREVVTRHIEGVEHLPAAVEGRGEGACRGGGRKDKKGHTQGRRGGGGNESF